MMYWSSSLYPQFTARLNAHNNLTLLSPYVGWLWALSTAPCILGLESTDRTPVLYGWAIPKMLRKI